MSFTPVAKQHRVLYLIPKKEEKNIPSLKEITQDISIISEFSEISSVYHDYQNQVANSKRMIKKMTGDINNPGRLWRMLEFYGEQTDKNDRQEHALQHAGIVWRITRTNPHYTWRTDDVIIDLLKTARKLSSTSEGSSEQLEYFNKFKSLIEKLVGSDLTLDDEYWWKIIDDASDLYQKAIVRTVDIHALEEAKDSLPSVLRQVLIKNLEPEYSIQSKKIKSPDKISNTCLCSDCKNSIDSDDFYCRHCGTPLGIE